MLRYLADTSAIVRLDGGTVWERLRPRVRRGLVGICISTELEIGYSTRSPADHERVLAMLSAFIPVYVTPRAEHRAREIQAALVRAGVHRAVSLADLLLAAIADVERLTILHYDADFELIASLTGQAHEWIAPRGSVD